MFEPVEHYLTSRDGPSLGRDLVDVLIVYYLFYRLLLVARGTRAMQIAAGLFIVAVLYVVVQALGLVTITTLVGSLLQSIILVIVVVFQNDIRRALQRVGSRAFFGTIGRAQESAVIDEVVQAAAELARHRIGAIITFEQDANLDEFIGQNKGVDIDAKVTSELLVSLFVPEGSNKLHDGAVIIRNLRIAKAGVFYPMPESRSLDPTYGSRHRAALGITEETDAVVIVVSEERGTISFCFNGNIAPNLQAEQLREMLVSLMSPKVRKRSREVQRKRVTPAPGDRVSRLELPPPSSHGPRQRLSGDDLLGSKARLGSTAPRSSRRVEPVPAPLRKGPPKVDAPDLSATPPPVEAFDDRTEDSLKLRAARQSARPMPKAAELGPARETDESDESSGRPR